MKAGEKYRLRILPAGRNSRMAELSDSSGIVLKYIYCAHNLSGDSDGLELLIRHDFESMEADEFAAKYDLPESPANTGTGEIRE
ncbi:MAG: hypothetical protein IBX61_05875 [Thermoleophilia bacterium]|nr:hypothetical protein [Thermoleophilia bacterium]